MTVTLPSLSGPGAAGPGAADWAARAAGVAAAATGVDVWPCALLMVKSVTKTIEANRTNELP